MTQLCKSETPTKNKQKDIFLDLGKLQEAVASIVAEERRLKPFFFAACRLLKTFGCLFRKRFKPNALDYYDGDPYIGSRTHQGISRII